MKKSIPEQPKRLSSPLGSHRYAVEMDPFGECSVEGVFLYNPDYSCHSQNRAAEEIFGYDKEDLGSLNILELFARDIRPQVIELLESPDDFNFEAVMRRRDDSHFRGLIHKSRLCNGDTETRILSCQNITQAQEFRTELERKREELESIFDNNIMGIAIVDRDRRITRVNRTIARWAGYDDPEEMTGLHLSEFQISRDEDEAVERLYQTELALGRSVQKEHAYRLRDGREHWFKVSGCMIDRSMPPDPDKGVLWLLDDIDQRKRMEKRIFETGQELSTIFDNTMMGVLVVRDERIIHRVNRQFLKMFGYDSEEEWIGRSVRKLHLSEENYREFGELHYSALRNKEVLEVEYRLRRKDGSPSWIAISGKALDPQTPADLTKGVVWIIQDINKRKAAEAELQRLAATDPLTGVLNRRAFTEMGERELMIQRRYNRPVSLLMLDIDHFKSINDRFGHDAGDRALRFFTEVCRKALRSSDILGRLGGEEFAVVLLGSGREEALSAAERIRANLEENSGSDADTPPMTVSIGLVVSRSEDNLKGALKRADKRLYLAKQRGRNQVCSGG